LGQIVVPLTDIRRRHIGRLMPSASQCGVYTTEEAFVTRFERQMAEIFAAGAWPAFADPDGRGG
jgi:hypothetical protein